MVKYFGQIILTLLYKLIRASDTLPIFSCNGNIYDIYKIYKIDLLSVL